jgi:antitoxin component HigA of HigAB toxin-antitoxin module
MAYTRKNRRGGGMFDLLLGKPKTDPVANLKAKRDYNLAHSKSRVANILGTPGNFKYTNKERIEENYQKAIAELKKLENPKETASALQTMISKVNTALQSPEARKTGAVVITVPVGIAQLFVKAAMLFLSALTFVFFDLPSMGSIPLSAALVPNRGFNTTKAAYNQAKRLTGANKSVTVEEFA